MHSLGDQELKLVQWGLEESPAKLCFSLLLDYSCFLLDWCRTFSGPWLIHSISPFSIRNDLIHSLSDMYDIIQTCMGLYNKPVRGFQQTENFENMMSDFSELNRHRSQRELFWNLETLEKLEWNECDGENKRRKRSGNLVICKLGHPLWSSFMGSPVCWRPHLCLRQISTLALQIHIPAAPYPRYSTFFSHFQLSTTRPKYEAVRPDEQFVCAEPRSFPQVIRDTMQTCCDQFSMRILGWVVNYIVWVLFVFTDFFLVCFIRYKIYGNSKSFPK